MHPHLSSLGWDATFERLFEIHGRDGVRPARVVAQHRGAVVVRSEDGEASAEPSGCLRHEAGPGELPVTGDWVALEPAPGRGIVHAVLPRRTAVVRKAAGRRTGAQVLAANVDLALIVTPLNLDRNDGRLERYLSAAWDSGAEPIIVWSKADLGAPVAAPAGVDDIATSTVTGEGIDNLRTKLHPNRTAVLLGPSGAGKSSLVNALCRTEVQAVSEVRQQDGRGRHTTTARELVVVPDGGIVIDTPGLRELGLWETAGAHRVFADVEDLELECRFRDCSHTSEPGCAVLDAIDTGDLDPGHLERHRKIVREAEYLERRKDAAAAANAKRRWKEISKAARAGTKQRDR